MSNYKGIIHKNLLPQCSSLTANSEIEPVENLKTDVLTETWKGSGSYLEITVIFSQAVTISTVSIVKHNIPQTAQTIQFQYSNDNFQNYDYINFTFHEDIMILFLTISSYTHYRFIIKTTIDTVEIGQIYMGTFLEFPNRIINPIQRIPIKDLEQFKAKGQKFKKLISEYWKLVLNFNMVSKVDYMAIYNALRGDGAKILVIDSNTQEAYQGQDVGSLEASEANEFNDFALEFEQNPYEIYG
jgi:hypothetical protein